MSSIPVGVVQSLHRYPVKSLLGETLQAAHFESRGVTGDRLWALEDADGKFGSGKTTRRFRRMEGLLHLRARYEEAQPWIRFPDGQDLPAPSDECHMALGRYLSRPVRVTQETDVSHFDEGPVHLVTTAALRELGRAHGRRVEVDRLRCNVLLDTPGDNGHLEASWLGARLFLGRTVELEILKLMPRCVMVNMSQLQLPSDDTVLQAVASVNEEVCLGVLARVVVSGTVKSNDMAVLHTL